ncbi:hypothetical protein ACROYT_G015352 [Oculina patagonica]
MTDIPTTAGDETSRDDQPATGLPTTAGDETSQDDQPATGMLTTAGDETSQDDQPATGMLTTAGNKTSQKDQPATGLPTTAGDKTSQDDQPATGRLTTAGDKTSQKDQPATGLPATAGDKTSQKDQPTTGLPTTAGGGILGFFKRPQASGHILYGRSNGWEYCQGQKNNTLNRQLLAQIIQEVGRQEKSDLSPGLKEGSYWYTISRRYLGGEVPKATFFKAVYNLWRYPKFQSLAVEVDICCHWTP